MMTQVQEERHSITTMVFTCHRSAPFLTLSVSSYLLLSLTISYCLSYCLLSQRDKQMQNEVNALIGALGASGSAIAANPNGSRPYERPGQEEKQSFPAGTLR